MPPAENSASRRSPGGRALAALAGLFALAFAAAQVLPARVFFDAPQRAAFRAECSLLRNVLVRNDMEAIWTFDGAGANGFFSETKYNLLADPDETSAIMGRDVAPGTQLVPGKFGGARRFPGRDDAFEKSGHHWKEMPAGFSVALWVKIEPAPSRQDIFSTVGSGTWGFRLDGGRIVFDATSTTGVVSTAAPFDKFGSFVHLAAVSYPERREVALYIDGALAATTRGVEMSPRHWPFSFGINSAYRVREPFHGDIDDSGVWNKSLSPSQIAKLAGARSGLVKTLSRPHHRLRLAATRAWCRAMAAVGRLALPLPQFRMRGGADAPARVSLVLAKGDARKLARRHAKARLAGNLTRKTARGVPGHLRIGGRTLEVNVSLFGRADFYPDSVRPAYFVEPREPGAEFPDAMRRIVLAPPESSGWALPLAESIVAGETGIATAPRCRTARLRVNGRDAGVYLLRDFSEAGASKAAGFDATALFDSVQSAYASRSGERLVSPESPSDGTRFALAAFFDEARFKRILARMRSQAAAIAADPACPVPARLRSSRISDTLRAVAKVWRDGRTAPNPPPAPLLESMLLGANGSASRVVEDLGFAAFSGNLAAPWSVQFESRNQSVVSGDGRIVSHPSGAPLKVEIGATLRYGGKIAAQYVLPFRVMPRDIALPSVFVWSGSWLDKAYRSDAVVEFYEAGPAKNAPDRVLVASLAGGGGVRWRGNSSFIKANRKKLLSVETDLPHGFFGGGETRKLLQINAQSDRLHVFNGLAYHLFREAPRSDGLKNSAPHTRVTELFVNGKFVGLAEWAERIDGDLTGGGGGDVFFRHAVARPRVPQMRQIRPSLAEADFEGRYRDLCALFAEPPRPGAVEKIASVLDLDNVADYQLLLDLFQNTNIGGGDFPFMEYLVLDTKANRFFHVPWDFDIVLPQTGAWLSTQSTRFLEKYDPSYPARLAARWRAWRAGAASDENLFGAFRDRCNALDGYLESEIALYENPPDPVAWIRGQRSGVENALRKQLRIMDERFGKDPD
ncbi:MAG: CotH kinase family protein [Kiritimatiellae bacterium]|nr:CotH kinase family protein [Kiritimatiellia bacterium]